MRKPAGGTRERRERHAGCRISSAALPQTGLMFSAWLFAERFKAAVETLVRLRRRC
jgi:hypothetical protein